MKNTSPASHLPRDQASTEAQDMVCPICRGAGFVHPHREDGGVDYSWVVPCQCVRAKLEEEKRKRMLRMCELPHKAQNWTFENFEVLPGLEEACEAALELAEEKADSNWLTLMGSTDRGKSHLLVAICHRLGADLGCLVREGSSI